MRATPRRHWSLKVNKTDANDAFGLAQIVRTGWYREVTVKGLDCQAVRALLVARAQIVSQMTTLKNCVRGILKTFGRVPPKGLRSQFPGRVRAAIDGHPVLGTIIELTLRVLSVHVGPTPRTTKPSFNVLGSDDTARQRDVSTRRRHSSCPGFITGVDPARFKRSSSVAAYFGMTPRRYQGDRSRRAYSSADGTGAASCSRQPKCCFICSRIERAEDPGEVSGKRIGAKKADAGCPRKLAVILHRMWTTGTTASER